MTLSSIDAAQFTSHHRDKIIGERKTQSIQFKRNVARELDKAGIAYKQDYCKLCKVSALKRIRVLQSWKNGGL